MLTQLVSEVKQLQRIIKEKDKVWIWNSTQGIITGLDVTPRTYARAAAEGRDLSEDTGSEEQQTLEMQVLKFLDSKNIYIDENSISACHTLPRRDRKSKPAIIVRFVNRKHKTELLLQGKKLKGSQVYINEHLTKKNAEIAREARKLRKNNKIQATWTWNCRVLIHLNGSTPEQAKVVAVRELKDLDPYR